MSYMNDDTDPFGVPYTPINQNPKKEIKEESTERFTYSGCIVYDKIEKRKHHRYHGMDMPETVELLNTLSVENEQLKKCIKEIDDAELHLKQIILKRIDDYIWEWEDEGTPVAQVLKELQNEIKGGDVEWR